MYKGSKCASKPKVCFITYGCAKNEVDTRDMSDRLIEAGFDCTDQIEGCSAIVVNTCSFIQQATEESIDGILDVLEDEYVSKNDIPVIIAGCMPSRYKEDVAREFPEVSACIPCSKEDSIVDVISKAVKGDLDCKHDEDFQLPDSPLPYAYIKISDGCDRWCSYCTIPQIRGRYHSFPLEDIISEATSMVGRGAKELVLIGQDTGLWGHDFEAPSSLSNLLDALASEFPDTWIRFMYTQPEYVDDALIDCVASHENIAPYFDIPMQHVIPTILKSMNRKGSYDEFLELVAKIRNAVPNVAIRTTLMCGFPGETDEDFNELLKFVEEAEFDYVGTFAFSPEDGTKACGMDNQVPDDEKEYRLERLRTVADAVSSQVIRARVGNRYAYLYEGQEEDGQVFGRAIIQAPESDGITYADSGKELCFSEVTIEDTFLYDMEGSVG